VGSSPFLAPAILSLIAAAQVDEGCWYSMGGTREVAGSLARILEEQGVETHTGVGVRRILTEGDRVRGVELEDGRTIEGDLVVSNCDVQRTYRDLLGGDRGRAEQRRIAWQYDHLAHHNFMFSTDSRREFDDLYRKGVPAEDPTLYLCVPSRTDPGQAPEGCEALYILVHTPYQRPGQRWDGPGGLLESYREVILAKLRRNGMPDLDEHIRVERSLTPSGIDRMYNAEGGAIYGLASHGRLHGGFKPRNRSRVHSNLYLAGGSANPGPGTPMVMMSGVTAAWSAAEDFGLSRRGAEPRTAVPAAV
jgi:diapolycopene oxygenase